MLKNIIFILAIVSSFFIFSLLDSTDKESILEIKSFLIKDYDYKISYDSIAVNYVKEKTTNSFDIVTGYYILRVLRSDTLFLKIKYTYPLNNVSYLKILRIDTLNSDSIKSQRWDK